MKGKRNGLDFSQHEMHVIKTDEVLIHHLKKPNTICDNIKYINCGGILAVTGDYGNWIFCREFHPSAEGGVSGGYWDEKLQICSEQTASKYCSDSTAEAITRWFEEENEDMNEEVKEWIQDLLDNVEDELDYTNIAYRQTPNGIDYEYIPFIKERHTWLNTVYDGFDELCRRYKEKLTQE